MVHIHVVQLVRLAHHVVQVVVVGHTHGHGIGVGLAKVGLGIVGNVIVVLIPVEQALARRIFNAVDMALGIALVVEERPSTARHLVGTRCDVGLSEAERRSWQHNLRLVDVLYLGNTTLERDVDVHHMALADRRDVRTVTGALLVVVLVDNGDDLLFREVEDVGLTAHIERAGLHRRDAVDSEVPLLVDQGGVFARIDDNALGNGISGIISAGIDTIDTCHRLSSVCLCGYPIAFAAIVIGAVSLCAGEGECLNIGLLVGLQVVVVVLRNGLSHSVGRIATDEARLNHIVGASILHGNGRIVTLLVEQTLIFRAAELRSIGLGSRSLSAVVLDVWQGIVAIVGCRIVHRLDQRVAGSVGSGLILGREWCDDVSLSIVGCSVVLVLSSVGPAIAVGGIDEQVEGVVVEDELLAVFCRHGAPGLQSTVILARLVVVATIETFRGTVVGGHNIFLDVGCQ